MNYGPLVKGIKGRRDVRRSGEEEAHVEALQTADLHHVVGGARHVAHHLERAPQLLQTALVVGALRMLQDVLQHTAQQHIESREEQTITSIDSYVLIIVSGIFYTAPSK